MAGRGTQAGNRDLKILDVMSKDVITGLPGDTLFAAVQQMSETEVSCLVVIDGVRVLGILTERDVLKAVAGSQADFHRITVAQTMSSPVQSVSPILSILTAGRIMEARQIRRLPVLEGKQLVGIVTQTDITRGLITLIPLRSISDIMTRQVATVAADASVAEAARIMASKRISCVVVMRGDEPAGILTEKDVIRRVVTAQKNPAETGAADVMSSPITTVPPSYSVLGVSRKMDAMHLHRLVVLDAGKLCGIVTQTDIMRAIRAELERVENERWGWMTELTMLIQSTIGDLQKLEELLRKLGGSSAASGKSADMGRPSTGDQVEIFGNTSSRT
jgi:CBS domain-containing protein